MVSLSFRLQSPELAPLSYLSFSLSNLSSPIPVKPAVLTVAVNSARKATMGISQNVQLLFKLE